MHIILQLRFYHLELETIYPEVWAGVSQQIKSTHKFWLLIFIEEANLNF